MLCPKCGGERVQVMAGQQLKWRCRPCEARYQRENYERTIEAHRKRMRARMRRLRSDEATAEPLRAISRRAYANGGAEKQRQRLARMRADEPFRWRAQLLRRRLSARVTAADLEAMWVKQGGLCGLTGQPMVVATAEIDHIIPRSRGGSDELSNLRWTIRAANQAKGDLLDSEFVALCGQVAEHIGRLIMEAAA